jgi:hypothetical protein
MKAECCQELERLLADDNVPIQYSPRVREWALKILNVDRENGLATTNWRNAQAQMVLRFCPFCGHEFPRSLREQFVDLLLDMGHEPFDRESRPEAFQTDQWWKERNL